MADPSSQVATGEQLSNSTPRQRLASQWDLIGGLVVLLLMAVELSIIYFTTNVLSAPAVAMGMLMLILQPLGILFLAERLVKRWDVQDDRERALRVGMIGLLILCFLFDHSSLLGENGTYFVADLGMRHHVAEAGGLEPLVHWCRNEIIKPDGEITRDDEGQWYIQPYAPNDPPNIPAFLATLPPHSVRLGGLPGADDRHILIFLGQHLGRRGILIGMPGFIPRVSRSQVRFRWTDGVWGFQEIVGSGMGNLPPIPDTMRKSDTNAETEN